MEAVMLTPEEEARKAELLQKLKDLEDGARARLERGRIYRFPDSVRDRRYSFARVPPEMLAEIRRFQQIFGQYIPCLLDDEHATIHLESRLRGGIFMNPIETINKSTFEADLKRFRGAMKVLAEWPIWGAMETFYVMHEQTRQSEPPVVGDDNEDVLHAAQEIYEGLVMIRDMADQKKLPQVLDQLEGWAREASEQLMDRRNINWEAVNAVDVLHRFWESWTETPAPSRALNPASRFADYLRDGFAFFKISGDPAAAFKRWVAVKDEKWK
jgi:hypothetical protein